MLSDIEIARNTPLLPIRVVAEGIGIREEELESYGRYKAKLGPELYERLKDRPDGRLVLVTAINPTPAGEGKTTTTVGLGQALNRLGTKAVVALREPSLGPVFGVKGGAAGGGHAQVVPMEDINLHFTGDTHAVTAANNLLAAMLDNHLQQGNPLGIDPRQIVWKRALDMNDRALRRIVVGLGGKADGVPREDGFTISAASEVMAVLCLADGLSDLKERLARMLVAWTYDGRPVTAGDLKAEGALAVLLKDALKPNLVQTLENSPALMHGGPFANIAQGCNSLAATRLALKLGEVVVTEAGFGADLGAEKFFDIKCRIGGLRPDAAVLVASVRALKYNGGVRKDALAAEDPEALARGLPNLERHVANLALFGVPCIVALNRFATDTETEVALVRSRCEALGVPMAVSEMFARGGEGGLELAELLLRTLKERPSDFRMLYASDLPLRDKIHAICTRIYGAREVVYSSVAAQTLSRIEAIGYGGLPVCIAKTQFSLTDDATRLGCPTDFDITVREIRLSAGAGFVVAVTGDILTMPGLPKSPAAERIGIDADGRVVGLF